MPVMSTSWNVFSNQRLRHVDGEEDDGRGIVISGGNTGGQVGGAGAGGGEAYAHLAGGAGITVGCVGSALLMGGQDMADFAFISIKRVVDVEDRAARVAEHRVDALLKQAFTHDLRSFHFHSWIHPS